MIEETTQNDASNRLRLWNKNSVAAVYDRWFYSLSTKPAGLLLNHKLGGHRPPLQREADDGSVFALQLLIDQSHELLERAGIRSKPTTVEKECWCGLDVRSLPGFNIVHDVLP